jgi:two-component system sensor histidine kinase/response regulator
MSEENPKNHSYRGTILVVDDVSQNIQLLASILSEAGFKVRFATNGLEALEIHQNSTLDLILLDIMMPVMDGYEAITKIRDQEKNGNVPIIFLTAKNDTEDLVQGFKLGAVDYITKPFNKEELLARVETQIRLRSQEQALRDLLYSKDRFMSLVSHDLRGPLSGLTRLASLTYEQWDDFPDEKRKEFLAAIHSASQSSLTLLENLLSLSLFQQDNLKFDPEPILVYELCQEIQEIMQFLFQQKSIQFDLEVKAEHMVQADRAMVQTVMRNLLSNALKFTPNGGRISIRSEGESDKLVIQVQDTGVGIKPEVLPNLFSGDKSYTSLGTNREKGTGFGLKLCKDLVEHNHGEIWVESIRGEGSSFYFSLPWIKV